MAITMNETKFELLNKLISPTYDVVKSEMKMSRRFHIYHGSIHLAMIEHHDNHTELDTITYDVHTIFYNDPDYQIKINQLLNETHAAKLNSHQLIRTFK